METITQRIGRIAELAGEHRRLKPPVPKSVKIELTARCNFQCFFCASHRREREKHDMPWKLYTRLSGEMRALGVGQLGLFYMGESFLCDWLPEAIRHAKRECGYPYVFLTTNGVHADSERVRGCMLAGLDSLKFGFNFSSPGQLLHVAGVNDDTLSTIVRNIKDARRVRDEVFAATGHHCALYASSLLYDEAQRDRMKAVLAEILPCLDEHYWLPLYGHDGAAAVEGSRHATNASRCAPVAKKSLPCWPLFKEGHITWDGRLSACCLDHAPRFRMGNLNEVPFLDAWHSRAYQGLRAAHLGGDTRGTVCEQCIAYT